MVATDTNPFDIFSIEAAGNHQLYARMRYNDPVHRAIDPATGQSIWFLTRYDDCVSFLKDKRFGKEFDTRVSAARPDSSKPGDVYDEINRHMLNLDDPHHNRLKSLVHKAFTPVRVEALRSSIQATASALLDNIENEILDEDEFNLIDRYAGVLPLLAIAEMLGIPAADYDEFSAWTHAMLFRTSAESAGRAIAAFTIYLQQQIDVRHNSPGQLNDLLSGLIFAEDAGSRLTRPELLAMVFLLLTAGYETMTTLVSNGVLALLEHPVQAQILRDNLAQPAVVKSAIEEMLRYNGPSYMTLPVRAYEDVEMGGKFIRQGDVVHALLHAANRDPAMFANPDRFDILRTPNQHIAFSYGIHYCLGTSLARLEGEIAITTLMQRMPHMWL